MKIEVYSRHGDVGFVVHAENEMDRVVLALVTSTEYTKERTFRLGGSTYECDLSATTSFSFGWVKN